MRIEYRLGKCGGVVFHSFRKSVFILLLWLSLKTKAFNLHRHLNQKWWIHDFDHGICTKVNVTDLAGIWNRRANFALTARLLAFPLNFSTSQTSYYNLPSTPFLLPYTLLSLLNLYTPSTSSYILHYKNFRLASTLLSHSLTLYNNRTTCYSLHYSHFLLSTTLLALLFILYFTRTSPYPLHFLTLHHIL